MIRIDGYPMDVALTEEFTFPGEVTEYPVEDGPDVSDHIRDLPEEITVECVVSDTPIGDVATDPTRQVAGPDAPLPSAAALAKLREIKARRRPVSIETSLGTFESMACLDVKVSRDASKSGGLFFTATFKKFNAVTNKRTKVRVKTPLAGAGGKPKSKVVVGQVMTVDNVVIWRHGNPPGAPFRGGLSQRVEVSYGKRGGLTRDETVALGRVDFAHPSITYFQSGSATPIVGAERAALVADLLRDADEARRAAIAASAKQPPEVQLRNAQNLPQGLSLERFQRPAAPTFPITDKDLDFVGRFSRDPGPPTIPPIPTL